MNPVPHMTIAVGVVVERCKAESPWVDYTWTVIDVLPGEIAAAPWTPLGSKEGTNRFYAGAAGIQLYRTEAPNYRGNLTSRAPSLWVVLRATGGNPPYTLLTVTADPAEGEAATEAGDDLVEAVRMPPSICRQLEAFVAEHGLERPFIKRRRDGAEPDGRRGAKTRTDNE